MRTEKTTAIRRRRSEAATEILEACRESDAVAMATSVLFDVLRTLRKHYGWTEAQLHEFMERLNEAQEERLREEAMNTEN